MENQNNNKGVIALLVVIIVILAVLCILFATGTITLKSNSVDNNNPTSNNTVNDNSNSTETTTNNSNNINWTQYILSQHILEANASTVEKTSTVTLDDLKEVLPKFENTKVIKTWYDSRGSMVDGVSLHISYENNDNKYIINIDANNNYCEIYGSSLNEELSNILESSITSEKNTEMKSTGKYFYELDGCDSSVLDKYVK